MDNQLEKSIQADQAVQRATEVANEVHERKVEDNNRFFERKELQNKLDERRREDDRRLERQREDQDEVDARKEQERREERPFEMDTRQGLSVLDERQLDKLQEKRREELADRQEKRDEQMRNPAISPEEFQRLQREKSRDYHSTMGDLKAEKAQQLAHAGQLHDDPKLQQRAEQLRLEAQTHHQRVERMEANDKKQAEQAAKAEEPAERNFAAERAEKTKAQAIQSHQAAGNKPLPKAQDARAERLQAKHGEQMELQQAKKLAPQREQASTMAVTA